MARHKVEICGVNTADIKVLSSDQQIELFKKYQSGDCLAKDKLVNGNLKLVLSILKPYNNRTDNMDDLFQIGCVGLIKAIDNFDLSHGVKFSTYAVPMILGEVKRYLRDNNSVRTPRSIKDTAYKALKIKEQLTNEKGREPLAWEIANTMGISEFEVTDALNSTREVVSISHPIYNDGGDIIYLEDQLGNDEGMYDLDTKLSLKGALEKLKKKEKYILTQRYLIGKTQMELAEEIGISQAQISRLEKSGIDNIKKMIR